MKMLDLFSGIGGFSLAAHWAGIETVAFCEQDKFCQTVLKKHWPNVPIVDDIFKLRGDEFGTIDIISGGFPCQPFSLAGKRRGTEDKRHLWPEMFRVISKARPAWVVGENVAGIINVALKGVLSDLESIGYQTQCFVIPACAMDAPHRRDRVWIMANTNERWRDGSQPQPNKREFKGSNEKENVPMANPAQGRIRRGEASGECGFTSCGGEVLADPFRFGWFGGTDHETGRMLPRRNEVEGCGEARREGKFKPGLGGMANGLPAWLDGYWPDEPKEIPRTGIKIPNRAARLKALGNAIVPQVVFMIFKYIMEVERMLHA